MQRLHAKIAVMEKNLLQNNGDFEEIHRKTPLDATLAVPSRKDVIAASENIITKGKQQLAQVLPEGLPREEVSPRVRSVLSKPVRERGPHDPPRLPNGVQMPVIRTGEKHRWNHFSFLSPEMESTRSLDMSSLMECLLQMRASQQPKEQGTRRGEQQEGGPLIKVRPNVRILSSELIQLFAGFSKIDRDGDGLLSVNDLKEFVGKYGAESELPEHMLQEVIYEQDDAARGALTFDAVQNYYMRLRPVLDKQLRAWKDPSSLPAAKINAKSSAAAVIRSKDKKRKSSGAETPVPHVLLPFIPLLLYRLLIFASFVGHDDQVHLLGAFQNFAEQYGPRDADAAFELVFLRHVSTVGESDKICLAAFVEYTRSHSLESTHRPTIFEPPVVRNAIPPGERRKSVRRVNR